MRALILVEAEGGGEAGCILSRMQKEPPVWIEEIFATHGEYYAFALVTGCDAEAIREYAGQVRNIIGVTNVVVCYLAESMAIVR